MTCSGTTTIKFKVAQQINKIEILHYEDAYNWNYRILSGNTVIGRADNVRGLNGQIRTINVTPGKYNQISIYIESIGNKWWMALNEISIYP